MAHKNLAPHPILTIFESLPGLYLIISPDFIIQAVSEAYLRETLTVRDDLVGNYIFDVFPDNPKAPEANAANNLAASFRQVLSSRQAHTMDIQHYDLPDPSRAGSFIERYWSIVNTPVLNQEGEVSYIIQDVINITEKIKAGKQLQESIDRELSLMAKPRQQRQRLEQFLMQAPALVAILDGPDCILEFANPAFQQAFPYCLPAGKPLLECLPELAKTKIPDMLQEVYHTGTTQESIELIPANRHLKEQPENSYYNIFLQARFDEKGHVDGIMMFAFDVSDKLCASKTLEKNNEQFQQIANAMPHKVWAAGANGEVDYLNEKWLTYTGLSYEELKDWGWKSTIHPDDWEDNEQAWQDSIELGLDFQLEQRFKRKDGQYRWHLTSGHAQRKKGANTVKAWIGTDTDIHDQKVTEQSLQDVTTELRDTNEQLTSMHTDLDNFMYIASHDLKTPIHNIEGLVKLLEQKIPPACYQQEPIQPIIGMIQTSVERFKKTVSSLTEITRLHKVAQQEPSRQSIAAVVEAVVEDLVQLVQETGTQLEVDVSDCPYIMFPENNLRAVVNNLLSNAILYHSPERSPKIQISCRSIPGFAILQIQDNGLGIDLISHEEKLFSMFNRLHTHVEGTGIGLFMVKRIVENAGGKIKVSSIPGEGSAFTVYFRQ